MYLVDVIRVRTSVGQRFLADVTVQLPDVSGFRFRSRATAREGFSRRISRWGRFGIVFFVGKFRPLARFALDGLLAAFAFLQINTGRLLFVVVLVFRLGLVLATRLRGEHAQSVHGHVLNQNVPVQIVVTLLAVEYLIRVLVLEVIHQVGFAGESVRLDGAV